MAKNFRAHKQNQLIQIGAQYNLSIVNNTTLDPTYDTTAWLSTLIGKQLLEKLALIMPTLPSHILNLSYGAKLPPLASASVDLVFSNLFLPAYDGNLTALFSEIKRALKPGGLFLFSTLGPDTLQELQQKVTTLIDMHDIGDRLLQVGLAMPVMEMEKIKIAYQRIDDLQDDLKILGIQAPQSHENPLLVTYEVIYGHAWQAAITLPSETAGETIVPLSSIKKPLRKQK